jgi:hypothetical protein
VLYPVDWTDARQVLVPIKIVPEQYQVRKHRYGKPALIRKTELVKKWMRWQVTGCRRRFASEPLRPLVSAPIP